MNIGARIIKTGLSVTLALIITSFINTQGFALSGVAAVIAIQPSVMRSYNYLKEVIVTNFIGALFAIIGFYLFGTGPIYIGLIVVLTLAVNLKLGLNKTANLAVLTVLAILTSNNLTSSHTPFTVIIGRVSMVGLGVFSSILINAIVLPPRHDQRYFEAIKKLNAKLNTLLRVLCQNELSIKVYSEEKQIVDKTYNKTKELFDLLNEEKKRTLVKDRQLFFKNIVVSRQMLRVTRQEIELVENIEKRFITLEMISDLEVENFKKIINELLEYQEYIMLMFENKIEPRKERRKENRQNELEKTLQQNINGLMKYYNLKDIQTIEKIFPIISNLANAVKEIKILDILVNNYCKKNKKANLLK